MQKGSKINYKIQKLIYNMLMNILHNQNKKIKKKNNNMKLHKMNQKNLDMVYL